MVQKVSLREERPDEQRARGKQNGGTDRLEDTSQRPCKPGEVETEAQIDQRGEEDVDVPGAHQHPEFLIDDLLVGKILPHEPARDQEGDEQ